MGNSDSAVVSCFLEPGRCIPEGIEIISGLETGRGGDRILHAQIARPKVLPKDPMPAVVWIHGGGWAAGTYEIDLLALHLAAQGYLVAGIQYRFSDEAKWPAQIEDCKLGVRWLRANAKKYHVNPARIGCWGTSAGGHLAACLGTMGDQSQFEGQGGYEGASSHVQAVADCFGPVDFGRGRAGAEEPDARGSDSLTALFGGPFQEKSELWKQGDPMSYVSSKAPPFLVIHGNKDRMVPYNQSREFVAVLKKAGVLVEFITVEDGDHDLRALPGGVAPSMDWVAVIDSVLTFFNKHL